MGHYDDIRDIADELDREEKAKKEKKEVKTWHSNRTDRVNDALGTTLQPDKEEEIVRLPGSGSRRVMEDVHAKFDAVKPSHYDGRKCMEIITEMVKDKSPEEAFVIGNVIKYLYRYNRKDGIKDVRKAGEYITMLVEILEKK